MGYVFERNLTKRTGNTLSSTVEGRTMMRWNPGEGTVTVGSYDYTFAVGGARFIGWDIPNYHRRMRAGNLMPHTPFYQFSRNGMSDGEFDVWTDGNSSHWWSVDGRAPESAWLLTEEDLLAYAPTSYDQYVAEAAAKIYSNGFDALTFLAELDDVFRMFRSVVKGLCSLNIPRNLRGVSSAWLSLRYGFRPLLYDIIGINAAIKNLSEKRTRYSDMAGNFWTDHFEDAYTVEGYHYDTDHTVSDVISTSVRGSVVADIEVPAFQLNPLITTWEVIPFSFVVDWLLNVGKSLAAISFLGREKAYSASKGYSVSVQRTYTKEIGETHATFNSGVDSQWGQCSATLEVRQPCRINYLPHFVLRMNSFKVFDLIGLILQRLK